MVLLMYCFYFFVVVSVVVIVLCVGMVYVGLIVQGICVVFLVSECEVILWVSNIFGIFVLV